MVPSLVKHCGVYPLKWWIYFSITTETYQAFDCFQVLRSPMHCNLPEILESYQSLNFHRHLRSLNRNRKETYQELNRLSFSFRGYQLEYQEEHQLEVVLNKATGIPKKLASAIGISVDHRPRDFWMAFNLMSRGFSLKRISLNQLSS